MSVSRKYSGKKISAPSRPRLLYLLPTFADYSDAFILREVADLRSRGFDLILCSLGGVHGELVDAQAARLLPGVHFSPPRGSRNPRVSARWARRADRVRAFGRKLAPGADFDRMMGDACWVKRIARRNRVTHLHAHFANYPAEVARMASMSTGLPYSVTAHAYDIYTPSPLLSWSLQGASFVVTCTQANASFLARRFPGLAGRLHCVHHGLDLAEYRDPGPRKALPHAPATILAVSRLVPKKGLEFLLEACALLIRARCPVQCRIIGSGPERKTLQMRVKVLGLDKKVAFIGPLPQKKLRKEYARARLFVQSSVVAENGDRDGLPNVLIEAMAMRLPVVASRVSAIPEAIQHGMNGFLVPPGNPVALARAIRRLIADPQAAARLATAGRRTVERKFDLAKSPLSGLFFRMAGRKPEKPGSAPLPLRR